VRSSLRLFWVCRIKTLNIRTWSNGGQPLEIVTLFCQPREPLFDIEHPDLPRHPILPKPTPQ
jgi:hypothetical protein